MAGSGAFFDKNEKMRDYPMPMGRKTFVKNQYQVQVFLAEEAAKEMTRHVHTMHKDASDKEEMEELLRDVCIKFASCTLTLAKNKPHTESSTYDLCKALGASSGGPLKTKPPPVSVLWLLGMVG